jgi:hypothetical protein
MTPRPRGAMRPSCAEFSAHEGVGNAGRRCTRSRACSVVNTRVSHHESTGTTRHSRTQWFYGLFRALPGDRALLPPSPADTSASLTPASGCQDHTTSPSALVLFVNSTLSVHRIPSRVRDDRDTPLEWDETAIVLEVIWVNRKPKYFCKRDWTTQITLIRFNKLDFLKTLVCGPRWPQRAAPSRI